MYRVMCVFGLIGALSSCAGQGPAEDGLFRGFATPPASARPHTWWHWMNGNITAQGITLDLEAMARVGVGGAQIFDVTDGILPGPVDYMSDAWRALVKHAVQEAERLGLELCIHNCAGWSSSGGPWVTPQLAMQMVVTSELRARGPAHLDRELPQPPSRHGFYRDIAVLAFATPSAERVCMADLKPQVTSSVPGFSADRLTDGNPDSAAVLPLRRPGKSEWVQIELSDPFTARGLTILPTGGRNNAGGELQVSEDGVQFRPVARFWVPEPGLLRPTSSVSFEPVTGRFFRLVFDPWSRGSVGLAEVTLEAGLRLSNWAAKAGYTRPHDPAPDDSIAPPEATVELEQVVDLTDHLGPDGHLTWDVPPGEWTILRLGHTPTGKDNHPAPEPGRGLECDKLSREAVDAHFAGMLGKVLEDIGPLAGRGLHHVLIDSYEVDCQNWTPLMRQEFMRRRGYDPLPYLPALTGRVIGSVERTERFLWDFRRTIADLYADNYYGRFAQLCHQHRLQLSVEPYGNGNFDDMRCGARADIPMAEFWVGQGADVGNAKLAASIAHTNGRKYVGAESFTADAPQGKWQNHPYSLKALGDLMYTGGINRFIFHRYAHQPWTDLYPGMTMGPHGFHFERTITWWEQSPAWLQYLTRCQYLLQEGLFVADLCYLQTEGAPNSLPSRGGLYPPPPAGYDYDGCTPETLLERMSVRDGRLVLPDGMSYAILVLPNSRLMTPQLLERIRDLVREGATVIGPRPLRSPSLQGYPECDARVRALADELWGDCDGERITEHRLGQGTVIWGRALPEVLAARGLPPDFEARGATRTPDMVYIHRRIGQAEVYFVSNQTRRSEAVDCIFRVSGRVPELWHPDTGIASFAPLYRQEAGRTVVSLRLEPAGSVFVVFRHPVDDRRHVVEASYNGTPLLQPRRPSPAALAITRAVYGVLSGELPEMVDVTSQVRALVRDNTLTVRADNSIAGDPALNIVKQLRVDYLLDGQPGSATVDEGATLRLPPEGQQGTLEIRRAVYGVLPPEDAPVPQARTVDVTGVLQGLVRDNSLSTIASNALAGDPAPLVVKQLQVEYTLNGQTYVKTVWENQPVELPDGTEREAHGIDMPLADLTGAADGTCVLTAWEAGECVLTSDTGATMAIRVPALPPPVVLEGPWTVEFPPNWGAPERATFDALMSWTESTDPGIKYFSGTATYRREFTVPAEMLSEDQVLLLDLGSVREIAQVRVNDRDLGILWKPPFRVDITDAVRPGVNSLEVRVTNLWPNRLIGDEQLPDDCEWQAGGPMAAWPAWLLEGTPRPPTGRLTFTTWKHYTKDSPLLTSGLLGPVFIRPGRVLRIEPGGRQG